MNSKQLHHYDDISFKALSVGIGLGELRSSKSAELPGMRLRSVVADSSHLARDLMAANSLADRAAKLQGQFAHPGRAGGGPTGTTPQLQVQRSQELGANLAQSSSRQGEADVSTALNYGPKSSSNIGTNNAPSSVVSKVASRRDQATAGSRATGTVLPQSSPHLSQWGTQTPSQQAYWQDRLKARSTSRVVHQPPSSRLTSLEGQPGGEVEMLIAHQARRWENRILAFTVDFMMVLLSLIVAGVVASLLALYKSGMPLKQILQDGLMLGQWQEFPAVKLMAHTNPLYVLAAVYGAVFLYVFLFKAMRGKTFGQVVIRKSIRRDVVRRKFDVA